MTSEQIQQGESLFQAFAGACIYLLGTGRLSLGKPIPMQRHLRWAGPLLVVLGVGQFVATWLR
jgi:hypothetical protein